MTQEDPSNLYLNTLTLIEETEERLYFHKAESSLLVASWKDISRNDLTLEKYKQNVMRLVELLEIYKPKYILVDCRKLGFEMTDADHRWYINNSKATWEKARIKKIAFVFKENLSAQAAMESLQDVALEENGPILHYRIFENNMDAASWLTGSK